MLDHVSFHVWDYEKSKRFHLAALRPLGYELVMELTREQIPTLPARIVCGLGAGGKPDFWLSEATHIVIPTHLAFVARTRAEVDAFHAAALEAGGTSNGEPGLRPIYHPNYYGAFVFDPDGNNIEAVCHAAE